MEKEDPLLTLPTQGFHTRQVRVFHITYLTPEVQRQQCSFSAGVIVASCLAHRNECGVRIEARETHLSSCLDPTSLSQASLSASGAINDSSRVKNRIVVSLADEAIYEEGPLGPGIIDVDQIELDAWGMV
jgi:hypothetical protein